LEFNVPFQHKYGYIRDENIVINNKPQLRCSGIYNSHFTTNLVLSLPVKQILKLANIWRRFRHKDVPVYCPA